MFLDLTVSKTSPLSLSEEDAATLAACGRGTILLDVAARADATLMALAGTNRWIALLFRTGRPGGEQVLGMVGRLEGLSGVGSVGGIQCRVLDAEDALGPGDGRPHTIVVTVNEAGTHLYADGYECFSATLTGSPTQIGLIEVRIDPNGVVAVTCLAAWDESLNDRAAMAQSLPVTPLVQFAASELSARDTRRTGALATGSIRALLRIRGRGQAGTIIAASGQGGTLHLDIDAGGLSYRVLPSEGSFEIEPPIEVRTLGHWDDETWYDVVVTSERGAVEIRVDGYQVALVPGDAFLADTVPVMRVVVGADLDGRRLFGEV